MPDLPTNTTFKTTLESMSVTGVTVHKGFPPASVSSSDLPLAFLELPSSGLGDYVLSCINNNKTRMLRYIILAEAAGQSGQETNYDLLSTLMDNLESALDTALGTVANFHTYEITAGTYQLAGVAYWAVSAVVTIRSV
jgi:hypothetical protein